MGRVKLNEKTVTILLCVLGFLGLAGIHRFYRGKILSGLLWLFTGGLFLIGTILDIAALGTKNKLWLE